MRLAKRYNGLAILWEHRYYGDSLPFPINVCHLYFSLSSKGSNNAQRNTTAAQWQFLTTDQALEDVVFFANSFPASINDSSQFAVHPSVTPWVWLGGSYPGVRGAFMRVRNPEVIFATWASSAPVHAQVDMAAYYKAAERSLTRNCSADWVAVTKYVDDVLNGTNETARTEVKFALKFAELSGKGGNTTLAMNLTMQEAANISNVDAASMLMDPLDFYQVQNSSRLWNCFLLNNDHTVLWF